MSYDYSENILVQESAGNLLRDELGWDVRFAYNREIFQEKTALSEEKAIKKYYLLDTFVKH